VLLVAVSLCVMIRVMMMLLIPVAMFYPVLAVCVICADCCSKMFTSAWMDQLTVFVFRRVCATVFRAKKNYVYVARLDRDSCEFSNGHSQCRCVACGSLICMSLVDFVVVLVLLVVVDQCSLLVCTGHVGIVLPLILPNLHLLFVVSDV